MTAGQGDVLLQFDRCHVQVIQGSKFDSPHLLGKNETVDLLLGSVPVPFTPGATPNSSSTNLATYPTPPPLPSRNSNSKLAPTPQHAQGQRFDEWLIVSLPGRYTLPLPAVAHVRKDGDRAYLFPIEVELFPLGEDKRDEKREVPKFGSDCTLRIVLPLGASADEQELLEEILANRTTFTPQAGNPFADHRGQVVMVDEADGSVVGVLSSTDVKENLPADADPLHSKDPVVITATSDSAGRQLLSIEPIQFTPIEGYGNSKIVGLGNLVSRGLVTGANLISSGMNMATNKYVNSGPRVTPERSMSIHPTARSAVDTIHNTSVGVARVTGATAVAIGQVAEALGARMGSSVGLQSKEKGPATTTRDGKTVEGQVKHPKGVRGFVNRSLVAFNAVLEGAEKGGKLVIASTVESGSRAIGHRYGDEAEHVARKALGVSNSVALVYIDVRGVSRRALLKSVGKAAIKGKTKTGQAIEFQPDEPGQGTGHLQLPGAGAGPSSGRSSPGPEPVFDDWKPPVSKR